LRTWTVSRLVTVLLIPVVFGTGCRLAQELRARQLMRDAKELYEKEDFEKACPLLERALELRPQDVRLKRSLAYCYMAWFRPLDTSPENQQLVDKAAAIWKEMLADDPDNGELFRELVKTYLLADRYEDALTVSLEYLQRHPDDAEIIQNVAYYYSKLGDFDKMLEWYQRWAEVEPTTPDPWYAIGSSVWNKVYCERLKCDDPTLPAEERGRYIDIGMQALAKAIEIDPKHVQSYIYMNLLYREKAKWVDKSDPEKFAEDMQMAEQYRQKAIQLIAEQKKKQQQEQNTDGQAVPTHEPAHSGPASSPNPQEGTPDMTPQSSAPPQESAPPASSSEPPASRDGGEAHVN